VGSHPLGDILVKQAVELMEIYNKSKAQHLPDKFVSAAMDSQQKEAAKRAEEAENNQDDDDDEDEKEENAENLLEGMDNIGTDFGEGEEADNNMEVESTADDFTTGVGMDDNMEGGFDGGFDDGDEAEGLF